MKTYIGTNIVNATEMSRGEYNLYRGWRIPEDENPNDEGFLIIDATIEHTCWKPKKVFEETYKHFTKMKKLTDTVPLMCSDEYKDRFVAEYFQIKVRRINLKHMLLMWDKNLLDFKPTVSREVYDLQLKAMTYYMSILYYRSIIEGIDLGKYEEQS